MLARRVRLYWSESGPVSDAGSRSGSSTDRRDRPVGCERPTLTRLHGWSADRRADLAAAKALTLTPANPTPASRRSPRRRHGLFSRFAPSDRAIRRAFGPGNSAAGLCPLPPKVASAGASGTWGFGLSGLNVNLQSSVRAKLSCPRTARAVSAAAGARRRASRPHCCSSDLPRSRLSPSARRLSTGTSASQSRARRERCTPVPSGACTQDTLGDRSGSPCSCLGG